MRETVVKSEEFEDSSWESIPSGWQAYSIGELMNSIKSGLSRAITFDDIGVPVITSTNLVDSELDPTDLKYWYEKDPQGANIADYILDDGDILLNFINSVSQIGKVCIFRDLGRPAIYTTNIFRIKQNNKVTTKFCWRLLQSNHVQHWIQLITKPAINQASFTQPEFAAISVVIPESKQEQECVTEILDTMDEAIAHTSSLIAKLKQMKAGLLHDLLTRGLDENGELRDAIAHPGQFKPSPLGQIPKDWEIRTCESVCREIVVGIVIKPSQYYQSSGVPALRSANVREAGLNPSDLVFISEQSNRLLAKSMIRTGDVLTVRTGYPGTSCVVPPEFDGANCVDIIISRPGAEIESAFLATWINSDFGTGQVLRVQGGLAQQHFNVGELQKLLIAKPAIEEQRAIQTRIEAYDTRILTEEAYRDKLKLQKQGLMHDLLTGKVRVKNA